jgi:hypothetical protein
MVDVVHVGVDHRSGGMTFLTSGPIVFGLTSASIGLTSSPVRWIIPKICGFSLASVPRPRFPFRRRRRPSLLFFHGRWIALMSRHHIDFVALDLAFEHHNGTAIDDPLTEFLDHHLNVVAVHVEFLGDLQARQVQPHEVQANDPGLKGLVVACEDGPCEVVKPPLTSVAVVALAMRLGVITPVLDDRLGRAVGADDPVGPAHLPDGLVAPGVVDEIPDVDHWSVH